MVDIKMGDKMYKYVTMDHETGVVILSTHDGGAALAKTYQALIIALYEKYKPTSNP